MSAAAVAVTVPRERPILFSAPMIRALLAGRKTQTRRLVRDGLAVETRTTEDLIDGPWPKDATGREQPSPYGCVGDRLWVRENWAAHWMYDDVPPRECKSGIDGDNYWFRADGPGGVSQLGLDPGGGMRGKWRNSLFMPRWASRLTLEITDVRVQRLQDISEEDARAEGLSPITKDGHLVKHGIPDRDGLPGTDNDGWEWQEWEVDPRKAFAKLWDRINGERAPWSSNPWLWVVSFSVAQP